MKKYNGIWKDEEIFALFKFVENFKKSNKPLLKAFELFAVEYNRKKNSVRNFYYLKLREFENSPNLAKKFDIDIMLHIKNEQKFFTPEETTLSMEKINKLLNMGYSVRKACFEVASGDIKEMLRLQNKYRSLKLKNQENNKFLELKIKSSSNTNIQHPFQKNNNNNSNLVFMPNRSKEILSDDEIKSLFMGLVNLVRRSAMEQVDKKYCKQLQDANFELRKSIKGIADKEREVKALRKKFELVTNEQNKLKEEVTLLRSQNVSLLNKNPERFNNLKNYIKKINKQTQKETN